MSADIKLETENEEGICSEEAPACLSKNVYHPRVALKNAIADWLPEFYISKDAWGPITKPHPAVTSKYTTKRAQKIYGFFFNANNSIPHYSGDACDSNNAIDKHVHESDNNN